MHFSSIEVSTTYHRCYHRHRTITEDVITRKGVAIEGREAKQSREGSKVPRTKRLITLAISMIHGRRLHSNGALGPVTLFNFTSSSLRKSIRENKREKKREREQRKSRDRFERIILSI